MHIHRLGAEGPLGPVVTMMQAARSEARKKRVRLFREAFDIGPNTRVLDLGAYDGSAIAAVLAGTGAQPKNIYIADADGDKVQEGQRNFGFVPVALPDVGSVPFDDGFFDIVYCSSLIERVDLPPAGAWRIQSDQEFRDRARVGEVKLANEIRRLAKGYFVQSSDRWFPLHALTWLPFIDYLPRHLQLRLLAFSNRYWFKRADPTWYFPTVQEMQQLFPEAQIARTRLMGLTKSIIAIKL
jgi:hypothetical protein